MNRPAWQALGRLLAGAAVVLAAGCAHHSDRTAADAGSPASVAAPESPPRSAGERAASAALAQLGAPYRFGGLDPAGFDCSGLVRYAYRDAGVELPRATRDQRKSVPLLETGSALQPGDLLFYWRTPKRKELHVALYVGGGDFVHAPSSGRAVRKDRLDDRHWRALFLEARRVTGASARVASSEDVPSSRQRQQEINP
ncbi:MAG: C40 family peptidase [Betaproteobacteria bacterium]